MKILEKDDLVIIGESEVATAIRWKECPLKETKDKSCVLLLFGYPKQNCEHFSVDGETLLCKKEK